MKATVPLMVPSKRLLKWASGTMRAIMSIDSFFSEIGRGWLEQTVLRSDHGYLIGQQAPAARDQRCAQRALADARQARQHHRPAFLLEDGGVHQQINAPWTSRRASSAPTPASGAPGARVQLIADVTVQIRLDLAPKRREPARFEARSRNPEARLSRARVGSVELGDLIDQCGFSRLPP